MDIISSALDATQLAPDECLGSTFDAHEQLQQRSSRLDIWHLAAGGEEGEEEGQMNRDTKPTQTGRTELQRFSRSEQVLKTVSRT